MPDRNSVLVAVLLLLLVCGWLWIYADTPIQVWPVLDEVIQLEFSPDGQWLLVGERHGAIHLRDTHDGSIITTLQPMAITERFFPFTLPTFHPHELIVAARTDATTIRLWQVPDGLLIHMIHTEPIYLSTLVFQADAGALVEMTREDATLRFWDVETGTLMSTRSYAMPGLSSLALSDDGQLVATADSTGTICIWNTQNKRLVSTLTQGERDIWGLVFSPDKQFLAFHDQRNAIHVWRIHPPELLFRTRKATDFGLLMFSPDSTYLVAGQRSLVFDGEGLDFPGRVRLWQITSGSRIATMQRASGIVTALAFSPDGHTLATASFGGGDTNIRLWDIP